VLASPFGDTEPPSERQVFHWETVMLRKSSLWLAALSVVASVTFAPANSLAGGHFGPRHGWSRVSHWAYYDGMFVPSGPFGYLHEYMAFNPSCAWLRRLVPTPLGPQWQLVPFCV
jgi:hypothetical protein